MKPIDLKIGDWVLVNCWDKRKVVQLVEDHRFIDGSFRANDGYSYRISGRTSYDFEIRRKINIKDKK